jgi:uncharacterized protein YjbI with pentapeptide repeats
VDSADPYLCILHDPDQNKNAERFAQALVERIAGEEADPNIEQINLVGVVFIQRANFTGQAFTKAVNFAEAGFPLGADFSHAHFGGVVAFVDAQFGRNAAFNSAHFGGEAYFRDARFGGGAYFRDARFGGEAAFRGAKFGGRAYFVDAQFGSRASFWDVQLVGDAYFADAHFDGEANFSDTRFGGDAYFADAHFDGEANFSDTQFGGEAYFEGARFGGRASFSRAVVKSLLSFVGRQTFLPGSSDAAAVFHELEPESTHRLRFQDVDLSRVSFRNTDVSQVHFVGCAWAQKSQPLIWPLPLPRPTQERLVIYEELHLDQAKEKREDVRADFPLVAERYRQLRLNLETSRQEAEAGHFYVGQMEMRRQDPSYSRPYCWALAAYRVLAMFGESYLRPCFFYFLFGAVFALAYLWGGFQVGQATVRYDPLTLDWAGAAPFFKDGVRAYVQALTAGGLLGTNLFGGPMGANLETTSWWVPAVRYLNMVLDTFLLGFFVIALRRHFHR